MPSVFLTDVDDYLGPSQACINPLFSTANNDDPSTRSTEAKKAPIVLDRDESDFDSIIAIDNPSKATAHRRKRRPRPIVISSESVLTGDTMDAFDTPPITVPAPAKKATVSVADCLACSGCVTSTEAVMINSHSLPTFIENCVPNKEGQTVVLTISPASVSDLAGYLNSDGGDELNSYNVVYRKLVTFLRGQVGGDVRVVDGTLCNSVSLLESGNEFLHRFEQWERRDECDGDDVKDVEEILPIPSISISATETRYLVPPEGEGEITTEAITVTHEAGRYRQGYISSTSNSTTTEEVLNRSTLTATKRILPMLASSCPGFVCYVEKTMPMAIHHLSSAKSPMAVSGALFKQCNNKSDNKIYHVAIMPCHDKKLEAGRRDLAWEQIINHTSHATSYQPDVNLVITTNELLTFLTDTAVNSLNTNHHQSKEKPLQTFFQNIEPASMESSSPTANYGNLYFDSHVATDNIRSDYSTPPQSPSLQKTPTQLQYNNKIKYTPFATSGGYADFIFRLASKQVFQHIIPPNQPLPWKPVSLGRTTKSRSSRINMDFAQVCLHRYPDGTYGFPPSKEDGPDGEVVLKFGLAYGFKNVQLVLQKLAKQDPMRHFSNAHGFNARRKQNMQKQIQAKKVFGGCDFHYIEVMACPGGCLNGGGQTQYQQGTDEIRSFPRETPSEMRERIQNNHDILIKGKKHQANNPLDDPLVNSLYHGAELVYTNAPNRSLSNNHKQEGVPTSAAPTPIEIDEKGIFSEGPFGKVAQNILHTRFHVVPELELSMGVTAGVAVNDTMW